MKGYDVIVLGAGHAGCEAALAAARMGLATLCLTLRRSAVALMPCNPAIGGTSKGHLVREVDALGGEMGLAADDTLIQMRMLNLSKGPAVWSPRAQMDKAAYHSRMLAAMEREAKLTLREGEAAAIETAGGRVSAVRLADGETVPCRAVIAAAGVYLKSRVLTGDDVRECGPAGLPRAESLSASLTELGISLRRFKTGTPPRLERGSIDYAAMEPQLGDRPMPAFSFLTGERDIAQAECWLTATNAVTHDVIRANIHRSPMYSGLIKATGTRYCPSIEDKIVRFADKPSHHIFIEPEGRDSAEMYVQGLSTSLPADVQRDMVHSIRGLENARIARYGYAIEYDCIDPLRLDAYLMARDIDGLYFAGQLNGSSGYEEAAAQGLYAGINCALHLKGEPPLYIGRADAYMGVLADDLTVKGTNEPYRMMTARSEYRLLLRQDNADLRLTEAGRRTGLVSDERYDKMIKKREAVAAARLALAAGAPRDGLAALMAAKELPVPAGGASLEALLRRPEISYTELAAVFPLPALDGEARLETETGVKYAGYIDKQLAEVRRASLAENTLLPPALDYAALSGLRIEARQKLAAARPRSLGQAARISGVSPADISVLTVYLRRLNEGA